MTVKTYKRKQMFSFTFTAAPNSPEKEVNGAVFRGKM